jgi:toxin HigB-1
MQYEITYTHKYNKKAAKFLKTHPDLKKQYQKTLEMLEIDPYHNSLRLHKLKGKLKSFYSASINISYRVTLDFVVDDKQIIPLDIGNHDFIYRHSTAID